MSEVVTPETPEQTVASAAPDQKTKPEATCESPPPASQPAKEPEPDPRAKLHALAAELTHSRNRRLIIEYLRLRRTIR